MRELEDLDRLAGGLYAPHYDGSGQPHRIVGRIDGDVADGADARDFAAGLVPGRHAVVLRSEPLPGRHAVVLVGDPDELPFIEMLFRDRADDVAVRVRRGGIADVHEALAVRRQPRDSAQVTADPERSEAVQEDPVTVLGHGGRR